jgi:hypothetical protein
VETPTYLRIEKPFNKGTTFNDILNDYDDKIGEEVLNNLQQEIRNNWNDREGREDETVDEFIEDYFIEGTETNVQGIFETLVNYFGFVKARDMFTKTTGFDGAMSEYQGGKQYVTLYPEQIKSVNNNGNYSKTDDNIYYQSINLSNDYNGLGKTDDSIDVDTSKGYPVDKHVKTSTLNDILNEPTLKSSNKNQLNRLNIKELANNKLNITLKTNQGTFNIIFNSKKDILHFVNGNDGAIRTKDGMLVRQVIYKNLQNLLNTATFNKITNDNGKHSSVNNWLYLKNDITINGTDYEVLFELKNNKTASNNNDYSLYNMKLFNKSKQNVNNNQQVFNQSNDDNDNNNGGNNNDPIDEVKKEARKEIDEIVNIQKQGLSKLIATLPAKMQAEIFRRFKKMDSFINDLKAKINDLKNREDFLEEDNQRLLAKYNEMYKMYTEEQDNIANWYAEQADNEIELRKTLNLNKKLTAENKRLEEENKKLRKQWEK